MKKILLLVAIVAASFSLNAQRNVDLQTTLNSPTNNQVVRSGIPFNMSMTITNMGPDLIKANDSAQFFWILNNNYTGVNGLYVFAADLAKDSSVTLNMNGLVLNGGAASTPNSCALVFLFNRGADPVLDTAQGGNNQACATLNYTVGVQEVLGGDHSVKMYPNPVTTEGTISYNLINAGTVSVKVLDITGREVATVFEGAQEAGEQNVKFDVSSLNNGIYFYQLNAGGLVITNKMVITK